MSRHIKSVTLNGSVCIHFVQRLHCTIEHLLHGIVHILRRIEHPVHHKYPIIYALLGVVHIEPFIVHIEVLKTNREKCKNDLTSIPSSSM